jgi:ribosomal protein L11 methyltransferase
LYSILICPDASNYDETIAALWELGTVGLIEDLRSLRAFFESANQLAVVSQIFERIFIESREEKPWDSEPGSQQDWDPILVGERFFVAPSEIEAPAPARRIRLTINAQSAFGSGRHESTQLMMQALETYLQPDMAVLDVGCGSGILGAAAQLLCTARVFACDIDPNAITVARRFSGVPVFTGSADAVRTGTMDLVLANITAKAVDALAPDLHRIAKPNGRIVISGFVTGQSPLRYRPELILEASEWQCWICKRDPLLAQERAIAKRHPLAWW